MSFQSIQKRVVIRVDASIAIGTGHVSRCLTLADALAGHGVSVSFLSVAHEGNLIDFMKERGFEVISLTKGNCNESNNTCPPDHSPKHEAWLSHSWSFDAAQCKDLIEGVVDWIIVDHYSLDYRWEVTLRDKCKHLMCIDDLADRRHDCDILLDQSLGRGSGDYNRLIPDFTLTLFGPRYALLREEFKSWRIKSLASREQPKLNHVLVTMGGVDKDNVTERVLLALQKIESVNINRITVVLGKHAPWATSVKYLADRMSVSTSVLSGVNNMAELMTSCDLVVCAGGATTWEKCSLGVPSFTVVVADNQRELALKMQDIGATITFIPKEDFEDALVEKFELLTDEQLKQLSVASRVLCDAEGAQRVVKIMEF